MRATPLPVVVQNTASPSPAAPPRGEPAPVVRLQSAGPLAKTLAAGDVSLPAKVATTALAVARPQKDTLVSKVARLAQRVLLRIFVRLEVRGSLPPGGGVIVANHPSYLDGPLGFALAKNVRPIAVEQKGFFGFCLRLSGSIIVKRDGSKRGIVDAGVAYVQQGGYIWMAPQGTTHEGPVTTPKAGAALIALKAGVPVIPMHIEGSANAWRRWWSRGKVRVTLGEPKQVARLEGERLPDAAVAGLTKWITDTLNRPFKRGADT